MIKNSSDLSIQLSLRHQLHQTDSKCVPEEMLTMKKARESVEQQCKRSSSSNRWTTAGQIPMQDAIIDEERGSKMTATSRGVESEFRQTNSKRINQCKPTDKLSWHLKEHRTDWTGWTNWESNKTAGRRKQFLLSVYPSPYLLSFQNPNVNLQFWNYTWVIKRKLIQFSVFQNSTLNIQSQFFMCISLFLYVCMSFSEL